MAVSLRQNPSSRIVELLREIEKDKVPISPDLIKKALLIIKDTEERKKLLKEKELRELKDRVVVLRQGMKEISYQMKDLMQRNERVPEELGRQVQDYLEKVSDSTSLYLTLGGSDIELADALYPDDPVLHAGFLAFHRGVSRVHNPS